jgi:hypothetical protein
MTLKQLLRKFGDDVLFAEIVEMGYDESHLTLSNKQFKFDGGAFGYNSISRKGVRI